MLYEDVLQNPDQFDFGVPSLGECAVPSPVCGREFVEDSDTITFASQVKNITVLLKTDGWLC